MPSQSQEARSSRRRGDDNVVKVDLFPEQFVFLAEKGESARRLRTQKSPPNTCRAITIFTISKGDLQLLSTYDELETAPEEFWKDVRLKGFVAPLSGDSRFHIMAGWWDINFGDLQVVYMEIDGIQVIYQDTCSAWRGGKEPIIWIDTKRGYSYALTRPGLAYEPAWDAIVKSFAQKHGVSAAWRQFPMHSKKPVWWATIKSWDAYVAHGQNSRNLQASERHGEDEDAETLVRAGRWTWMDTGLMALGRVQAGVWTRAGEVNAGREVNAGGGVDGSGDMAARGGVDESREMDAGGEVNAGKGMDAGGDVDAGGGVDGSGDLDASGEIDGSSEMDAHGEVDTSSEMDTSGRVDVGGEAGTSGNTGMHAGEGASAGRNDMGASEGVGPGAEAELDGDASGIARDVMGQDLSAGENAGGSGGTNHLQSSLLSSRSVPTPTTEDIQARMNQAEPQMQPQPQPPLPPTSAFSSLVPAKASAEESIRQKLIIIKSNQQRRAEMNSRGFGSLLDVPVDGLRSVKPNEATINPAALSVAPSAPLSPSPTVPPLISAPAPIRPLSAPSTHSAGSLGNEYVQNLARTNFDGNVGVRAADRRRHGQ